jgi:iron(III) transport system substrate-binding protein
MKTSFSTGIATSAVCLLTGMGSAAYAQGAPAAACEKPTEVAGFQTCADVEAAKKEGAVVLYAPAGQTEQLAVLAEFNKLFPDIRVQSVWAQTGSLVAKVEQEVKTDNTLVDVLVLSDPTLLNDFQKKEIYAQYVSPGLSGYSDPNVQSKPVGYWTSWGLVATTIVYNTDTIGDNPPKSWKDLIGDERFKGRKASVKNTTSGLQFAQWAALTDLYGQEYWTQGIAELQPVAFDSFVQQYDRLVGGTDMIAINGQISGAMGYVEKGAPLTILYPEDGVPATLEGAGVVTTAPHPQAARLLLDFLVSKVGQEVIVDKIRYFSPRSDVAAPENSGAPENVKFLVPDWGKMAERRSVFEADWQKVLGQ